MRLPRRVQVLLVVFVALVVLALGLDITVLRVRQHAFDRRQSTFVTARLDLLDLQTSLVDQETGERGYLITGREDYLQPFESGRSRAAVTLARLRRELAGHDDLIARLDRLESKISAWQSLGADFEIAATRDGRDQVVVALVAGGTGKRLFDGVRSELGGLRTSVDAQASSSLDDIDQLDTVLIGIDVGTLVLALALMAAAFFLARRWFTRPLVALSESVQEVVGGSLHSTVSVTGPPEFRELAADVDAMRRRILAEVEEAERAREALAERGMIVMTLRDELAADDPSLPEGLEVVGRFSPAQGIVAGDWYDVVRLGEHRIAVALVDVSGHGAGVGAFALRTKALALAAIRSYEPGDALAWLASRLGDTGEQFLTGVVLHLDARTGEVRYASAGHPPLLLAGVTGVTELEPTGPLLGPVQGTWSTTTIELNRGGVLMAFSDGLVEARDAAGNPFGIERLRSIVEREQLDGASAVADACLTAVQDHQAAREDDLTIVVMGR